MASAGGHAMNHPATDPQASPRTDQSTRRCAKAGCQHAQGRDFATSRRDLTPMPCRSGTQPLARTTRCAVGGGDLGLRSGIGYLGGRGGLAGHVPSSPLVAEWNWRADAGPERASADAPSYACQVGIGRCRDGRPHAVGRFAHSSTGGVLGARSGIAITGRRQIVQVAERDNVASMRCLIAAGFTEAGPDELGPLFRLHLPEA
jgi:hypothetical protein